MIRNRRVFNNAGIDYASAGCHETGLGYLTRGLELAPGDRDRDRLADFRARSLAACHRARPGTR